MVNLHTQLCFYTQPTKNLQGELTVPGDKSISHRALILGAIAKGITMISGFLRGADNVATMLVMRNLGVQIDELEDRRLRIHGVGMHGLSAPTQPLDLGNSGTALRILLGLLSAQSFDSILIGDESLSARPMARVVNPLQEMGAVIAMSAHQTPPLKITGKQTLHGIEYAMPIASAQVKSCLLLAGLYAQGETKVIEPAPTRDHTERMLQALGYPININSNVISLQGGGVLHAADIVVPADISSAAFFMVAASIVPGADIVLKNVGMNSTRTGVIQILQQMGANIEVSHSHQVQGEVVADVRVRYVQLKGIAIPEALVPLAMDEFPILFVAAACAKGETTVSGARELRVKETDRIAVMAQGLQKLGIKITPREDGALIEGGVIQGGEVDSGGDHRIAMAFAVAGAVAQGPIEIRDCLNVETSFPEFIQMANTLGLQLTGEMK